ncbi:hypothetical protein K4K52_011295 [Colletotrichum sp. SAR 10_76]|nr:hypothetical protein K4K52_011295 [Colletotrichum sp. SAR 10_76]
MPKPAKRPASQAKERQGGKKKARIGEVANSDDEYSQNSDDGSVDTGDDLESLADLGAPKTAAKTDPVKKTPARKGKTAQGDAEETDEDAATSKMKKTGAAAKKASAKKKKGKTAQEESEEMEEDAEGPKSKTGAAAKKSTSAKKKKGETAQEDERICEGESPAWINYETAFFGVVNGQGILRAFNAKFPRLKTEELDDLLPETLPDEAYDEDWTAEDEAELRSEWMEDPQRKDLIDYRDKALPKLFRASLRIFHLTPFEIISDKYFLGYEGKSADKSQKWTTTFSQLIYELMVHPLWNFDLNMLRTAMQYAVILRNRDVRTWKFVAPNNDPFFQTFKQVITDFKGQDRSVKEHHTEVRARLKKRSVTIPPYSQFLRCLESTVVVRKDIKRDMTDEHGPVLAYRVNNHDLKYIKQSLDSMTHIGMPYFPSTEVYCRYILGSRQDGSKGVNKGEETKDEPPVGEPKLREYVDRAMLAVNRIEAKGVKQRKRLRQMNRTENQDETVQVESSALADVQAQLNTEKISANKLRIKLKAKDAEVRDMEARMKQMEAENARLETELEDLRGGTLQKAPRGKGKKPVVMEIDDNSSHEDSNEDSDGDLGSSKKKGLSLIPGAKDAVLGGDNDDFDGGSGGLELGCFNNDDQLANASEETSKGPPSLPIPEVVLKAGIRINSTHPQSKRKGGLPTFVIPIRVPWNVTEKKTKAIQVKKKKT